MAKEGDKGSTSNSMLKHDKASETFYSNGTSKNDISIPRIELEKLGILRMGNSKIRFKESRER